MAITPLLLALAFALISLGCSIYFQQHFATISTSPVYIVWITLSASLAYALFCFAIIHYLRHREQQQHPREAVESPGYRVSRRSHDTDTSEEMEEIPTANHDSLSTFYYCHSSFAAIHLNSAMSTPRTPETVIVRPPRSSSLLPPPVSYPTISPRFETKLGTASKLSVVSLQAVKVDVPPTTPKQKDGDVLRRESVETILKATERRSGKVAEV